MTARFRDLLGHVGAWAPRPEQVAVAGFLQDDEAVRGFQAEMLERVEANLEESCKDSQDPACSLYYDLFAECKADRKYLEVQRSIIEEDMGEEKMLGVLNRFHARLDEWLQDTHRWSS